MWRYAPGIYEIRKAAEWLRGNGLMAALVAALIVFGGLAAGSAMDAEYEAHSAYMAAWIENPGNAGLR